MNFPLPPFLVRGIENRIGCSRWRCWCYRSREGMAGDPPLIAGYEILGELGRGGMGVVYHAQQLSLGRDVALKIVLAGCACRLERAISVRVEAETAARLKHPNIVAIYEIGEQNSLPVPCARARRGRQPGRGPAKRPMAPYPAAEMAETLAQAMELCPSSEVFFIGT